MLQPVGIPAGTAKQASPREWPHLTEQRAMTASRWLLTCRSPGDSPQALALPSTTVNWWRLPLPSHLQIPPPVAPPSTVSGLFPPIRLLDPPGSSCQSPGTALLASLPHSSAFSQGRQGAPPAQPPVPGLGELERARLRQGWARAGSRLPPSVERQPPVEMGNQVKKSGGCSPTLGSPSSGTLAKP